MEYRLIDPTPEKLARTLTTATSKANNRLTERRITNDAAYWARWVSRTRNRAEGRQTWMGTRSDYLPTGIVSVGWWTDHLGRKHWRIIGRRRQYESFTREPKTPEWPLWFVYPDHVAGRLVGKKEQLLVCCDCGACGDPAAVGWTGTRCGPCHDRQEEGDAPLPRAVIIARLKVLPTHFRHLSFLDDGRLVCAGDDDSLVLVDPDARTTENIPHRYKIFGNHFAANGRGRLVYLTSRGTIWVHDLLEHKQEMIPMPRASPWGLALSPDGRWLAIRANTSQLLDLQTRTAHPIGNGLIFSDIAFSPDSSRLYMLSGESVMRMDVATRTLETLHGAAEQVTPEDDPDIWDDFELDLGGAPDHLALTPQGDSMVVLGMWNRRFGFHLFDLATRQMRRLRMSGQAQDPSAVQTTSEGLILGLEWNGRLHIWESSGHKERGTLYFPHSQQAVMKIAFSDDGERLALGYTDGSVTICRWRSFLDA